MSSLAHDLRVSVRALRKSPGFVAVAVLSLALGIGANTTIFTAVDVFLLRPLPYPDPEQLVQIWTTNPERGWTEASSAIPDMLDWREQSRTAHIASYYSASFNASSEDRPERLRGVRVTANLLDVLGLAPALGRVPRAEEEAAGAARVALISTGLWHRVFTADPAVIGRVLNLDGVSHEVIGVLPADLKFPDPAVEVWVPLGLDGRDAPASTTV